MKEKIQIAHVHLETPLVLSDEFVQLLIIENPSEFYQMVSDLIMQFDGEDGAFVFSRSGQIIDASKNGVFVSSPFHFDLNDKKVLSLLQKRLEELAFGEKLVLFNELSAKTMLFLGELSYCVPFSLDYNEPQPIDYLKGAGIKFEKNYDSLEEKVICYINALVELKKCEFFIFVNLKSVLSNEKISQIYNHCRNEQVGLMLIESEKRGKLLPEEKAVIITQDLCEILENYNEI